jgi:GntR family transcriptional repressor for pyruvate dehydrogenase complex
VGLNQQRQELIQKIYFSLKKGEILRGDQLFTERELIDYFDVKRGLLREALISLDTLGVIEIRERQGMFLSRQGIPSVASGLESLSSYSPIDIINQTFEVRLMIETQAAALAAERRNEHACSLIQTEMVFYEKLRESDHPSRAALGFQHNKILHNIIIDAAGNQVLQETLRGILSLNHNAFAVLGSSSLNFQPYALWFDTLAQEHIEIADAIIKKDKERAFRAMETHLLHSSERNKKTLAEAPLLLYDSSEKGKGIIVPPDQNL